MTKKQRNSLRGNQMRHLNGAKFASAPDQTAHQFRAKTAMVGICSTFAFATETTVEELKNCSKNENTAKSAGFWLSVSKNWCVDKGITDDHISSFSSVFGSYFTCESRSLYGPVYLCPGNVHPDFGLSNFPIIL